MQKSPGTEAANASVPGVFLRAQEKLPGGWLGPRAACLFIAG